MFLYHTIFYIAVLDVQFQVLDVILLMEFLQKRKIILFVWRRLNISMNVFWKLSIFYIKNSKMKNAKKINLKLENQLFLL